jgi:23S rRNA (pseudouridine1915-N3)-methyltransferase
MRIGLLWVGKGRDKLLAEVAARYEQRLSRSVRVVTAWVPEVTGRGRTPDEVRRLEAERLREMLSRWHRAAGRTCPVIALDERGALPASRELAAKLQAFAEAAVPQVSFVIGGDEGLDPSLRKEADEALALSRLTFTHEMARAILLEQLFRAQSIRAGHPYHRE